MTRPKLILGVLAAAGGGTLLWYAWLIVSADLPRGARAASWVLWGIATAAALTLFAYLREFLRHRAAAGREATWRPLPGLVLLWVGGVTAFVAVAFVLPDKTGAAPRDRDASTASVSAQTTVPTTGAASTDRTTPGTASRSTSRRTAPAPVSTTSSKPAAPAAVRSTTTSSPTPSATSSGGATRHGKPTSPPGKPTPSSTTTTPLIGITLPTP